MIEKQQKHSPKTEEINNLISYIPIIYISTHPQYYKNDKLLGFSLKYT